MRTRNLLGLPVLAIVVGSLAEPAHGSGFALQDFDAKSLGMANAFSATADNPSAVYFNPAAMTQLDGFQSSFGLAYIAPTIHYDGATPADGEANVRTHKPILVPSTFLTYEISDSLTAGLGIFAPFGLAINWGRDWPGRYIVSEASIQTLEVNPNLAYKMPLSEGTSISAAVGVGVIRTAVKLEQMIDLSAAGAPDGRVNLEGDHINFTWNFALLLSLMDRKVRAGFGYRAPVEDVKIRGTAEFYSPINPSTGQPFAVPDTTSVFTRISHPDQVRAGLAVQPIDPLTLEFDFTWTNWSKVDKVFIEFDDLASTSDPSGHRRSLLDFGLVDSYFFALGADYEVSPAFSVRGGVYLDETPVQADKRSPTLPDEIRKGFSLGIGVSPVPSLTIDMSYLSVFFDTAHKDNEIGAHAVAGGSPRGNGDYTTIAHIFAVTFNVWLGAEEEKK